MTASTVKGYLTLLAYVSTIVAANWAVAQFGAIPVGFGLVAPAGVLFAGLAFTLRNVAQDFVGRWPTVFAMIAGTILAYFIASPALAIASAAAFGFSELADFTVYTWLRRRRLLAAYAAAATVGLIVDSFLFVGLAFGSLAFVPGQIVGKAEMTLLALAFIASRRKRRAEA